MRIFKLSSEVANQIAAGEVIERPASVVKELVENAIDAGACSIDIHVDSGGLNRIVVSDDGSGIVAEDLPLAITAHATSKIVRLNDLYTLSSMGFRGEALASIASVSKLTILSKPTNQIHAMQLTSDENGIVQKPCARQQGTTVDVLDLFYNAPVRKHFLKSAYTEFQAIDAVVRRLAMGLPSVRFTLHHNQKCVLSLPATTGDDAVQTRIKKALGQAFVKQALYFETKRVGLGLHGWISGPQYQRSQNDKLWVYVNHRMVKDKLIFHAIKKAYEPLLHQGRYPSGLVYLSISPDEVDVNVHPTKHEVRFQQPRLVHDFIVSELTKTLSAIAHSEESSSSPARLLPVSSTGHSHATLAVQVPKKVNRTMALPNSIWILNEAFGIILIKENSWLVDVKNLQKLYLIELIKGHSYPFPSRSLLVPVSYSIDRNHQRKFEALQPALQRYGIQFDFLDDQTIVIRSVPCMLPQLNLQKLILGLSGKIDPFKENWLVQLVDYHDEPLESLTLDKQAELVDFFETYLSRNNPPSWCRCLDLTTCRAMICQI